MLDLVKLETPVKNCFVFPSENVLPPPLYSKLFNVEKLFEGESVVWSIDVRLFGVKVLPRPEVSVPRAPALAKANLNPFVP